jgi:large conductance mechanosensitive channel
MFRRAVTFLKGNLTEFKEFAFKGNLIQLAIGVVLGAAFGNLIASFVKNLFMPLINVLTGGGNAAGSYLRWEWKGIAFGAFLGDLINFLIVALAIFLLTVKVVGWIVKLSARQQKGDTASATTKTCPHCLNTVPILATRCGFCTSDIRETLSPATVATAPTSPP